MLRKPDYERGPVRLWCDDCRNILPHLSGVDAVVTDPPYSIVNRFGTQKRLDGSRRLEFDWDHNWTSEQIAELIGLALDTSTDSAGFFVFCGTDQVGDLLPVMRSCGFTPKPAAWVKECPPPAMPGTWWPSAFELAFYGYKSGAYFGDDNPKRSNVFVEDSYRFGQPGKVDHPTQKPLTLMRRIVEAIVPPGGTAIDPFLGSGTTAVACAMTGRRCIGIEREPKYFDIAVARINRELDQPRLFPPEPVEQPTQAELF